jgi:hypothetical protein
MGLGPRASCRCAGEAAHNNNEGLRLAAEAFVLVGTRKNLFGYRSHELTLLLDTSALTTAIA